MSSSSMTRSLKALTAAAMIWSLGACAIVPQQVTVPVAPKVDLARYMGPWYVISVIPTFLERDIANAVESYERAPDGTIRTTFTFNQGGFNGPAKCMKPKGFVIEGSGNAVWGMQFVWPIKAEFVISHVDAQYSETIIARSARDYVWIMARTPQIDDARYAALVGKVKAMGYDTSKLVKVPQQPGLAANANMGAC